MIPAEHAPALIPAAVCGLLAVSALVLDLCLGRIPDYLTIPSWLAGMAAAVLPGGQGVHYALLGTLAGAGPLLALHLFKDKQGKRLVGGGDVKLMAAAGSLTGWLFVLTALMTGALVGLLLGAWAALVKKPRIRYGAALSTGLLFWLFIVFVQV